jgi:hypothetical protein
MFVFFSNKLGCIGSLVLSIVLTVVMILVLRACTGATVW